jgi:hypothetical protein
MHKISLVTLFLFLILSTNIAVAEEAGFDELCKIFIEVDNSNMTNEQRNVYVFSNVKSRINVQDTLDIFDSVFLLDPKERYPAIKKGAEMSLKHPWDCPAMKKLFK